MLNRFLELFKPKPTAPERYPDWYLEQAQARQYDVPPPEMYEAQADLMRKVSYLYTVVTLTGNSAASADFDVEVDGVEIEGHPLEKLLDDPNPLNTGVELLRDTFIYRMLNGQAFWWMNIPAGATTPTEIWNIPPGNIEPIPSDTLGISGYWYYPGDGSRIQIPPELIVWFKGFHPSNPYASLSGLVPLSLTMQTDIETQRFLSTVYGKNSGRLPGIIAFKSPVNDNDWKKIKGDVLNSSRDRNYMMLRAVGDGVTWLQAAANLSEMETLNGRRMTREDIYNTFAPGLFNMTDVSATEANAKVGKQTFAEFTLYPMLRDLTERINKAIAPLYGPNVKVEFEDPRELKAQQDAAKMALETQRASVFTAYVNAGLPKPLAAELADLKLPEGMEYDMLEMIPAPMPEPTMLPALPAPAAEMAQTDELAAVMSNWRAFAKRNPGKQFKNSAIPPALYSRLSASLKAAKSDAEIDAIFDGAANEPALIVLASAINRMVSNAS